MTAVLNTNVASLMASKNLLGAQTKLANSVERLSSGSRINRAADDAAGLGVAQSLTRQINGANQGMNNLNDGISMVQTAEGALAAATEMGQRILQLAVQGSNGPLGTTERAALREEMDQLLVAIQDIVTRTKFSGNELLTDKEYKIQVSNESADVITLAAGAFANIGTNAGKLAERLKGAIAQLDATTDVTPTVANGVKTYAGAAANAGTTTDASVLTTANFQDIVAEASDYVTKLVSQRSLLGAYQAQMEYTLSNTTELSANLQAARSRVIDTDYAAETARLTRGQILQQAATAMLAQANQMPNVILTLLK